MTRRDPFVGFGDDQNTSVKFQVVHNRGSVAQWEGGAKLTYHSIGGGQEVVQALGRESRTIQLRLLFDTLDGYELMDSLQGYQGTLRYLWGITTREGGTKQTILNSDYLVLPDTILQDLSGPLFHLGGMVECTATFRRAYVASPYVGFTIVGEDL